MTIKIIEHRHRLILTGSDMADIIVLFIGLSLFYYGLKYYLGGA